MNAKSASERSVAAYLTGNARHRRGRNWARAPAPRSRSTGRADLLARRRASRTARAQGREPGVRGVASHSSRCASMRPAPRGAPTPTTSPAKLAAPRCGAAARKAHPRGSRPTPPRLQGIADPLSRLVGGWRAVRIESRPTRRSISLGDSHCLRPGLAPAPCSPWLNVQAQACRGRPGRLGRGRPIAPTHRDPARDLRSSS